MGRDQDPRDVKRGAACPLFPDRVPVPRPPSRTASARASATGRADSCSHGPCATVLCALKFCYRAR
eukprot:5011183-Prymnesium_polylepis.1